MEANATIKTLGMEVVQSIQNLKHEIPLLADKATMVRVYVRPTSLALDMSVRATLEVRRTNEKGVVTSEVESDLSLGLQTRDLGDDDRSYIASRRRFLDRSLNFRLSKDQIGEGKVEFRLIRVTSTLPGNPEVVVENHDHKLEVNFERGPILRVRAVGLRVRDPQTGHVHAPKPWHFESLRSYLERAFPVSKVEWSQVTVDAPAGFEPPYSSGRASKGNPGPVWQERFDKVCAQLMAIRARDVDEGADRRTHYYGMVYHPNHFFVGAVSNVPTSPRPDIVGVGPAEMEDGSWGAHELAHALGRLHPGFCDKQSPEDPDYPAEFRGKLSSSDADGYHLHHGLDVGDSIVAPRVLPSDECYDLMTYCRPLWVSAYTYTGMLNRLRQEEELVEEGKPAHKGGVGEYLQIVGTYNIEKKKGALSYVFPVSRKSPAAEETEPSVVVVGMTVEGETLFESNVELKRKKAKDLAQNSGAFQITVPLSAALSRLELRVDGRPVAAHALGAPVSSALAKARNSPALSTLAEGAVKLSPPVTSPDDPYLLNIAWPTPYDPGVRYTVRARLPDQKWQTIAVGITDATKQLILDRRRFELPLPLVTVQILRSRGLSESLIYEGTPTIEA
jgi:hypothetical protein